MLHAHIRWRGDAAVTGKNTGIGAIPTRPTYFRAVALDVDGTLAQDGRVSVDTLRALGECRARGVAVILVTGRTLDDLGRTFPDLLHAASAVVTENGACLASPGGVRRIAARLDPALGALLSAKGVRWSTGEVVLACSGADEATVLEAVRELGHSYQLVRNRAALMVLPAGVTKGSGLVAALGELGLSAHSTIGIGDAENDHSLLDACELGVAVPNAVEALQAHADLVLDLPDGAGVASLLRGGLLTGEERRHSDRWRVHLGTSPEGEPVMLPASQLNVIVAGDSGDGKSYLAGLIAEQLVGLGYSLLALDPEGDHVGLGQLSGVSVLDARVVPGATGVVPLLIGAGASAVVDLSGLDAPAQRAYLVRLSVEIEAMRAASGLPHWVLLDEAHRGLHRDGAFEAAGTGHLFVTWQPEALSAEVLASADAIIAVGAAHPAASLVDLVAAASGVRRTVIAGLLEDATGQAVLALRQHPGHVDIFTFRFGERRTPHLRHEHKYQTKGMDATRRFYFRTLPDTPTGRTAGNLAELEAVLTSCDEGVLRHHCPSRDFSRWIGEVLRDHGLADRVAVIEQTVGRASPEAVIASARVALIGALHIGFPPRPERATTAADREAGGEEKGAPQVPGISLLCNSRIQMRHNAPSR